MWNDLSFPPDDVLISSEALQSRLDALAGEIQQAYVGLPLTILSLLNGSLLFTADLIRRLNLPLRVETLHVSSYHGKTSSSGCVQFQLDNLPDLTQQHVLIVDDILDTGKTLSAVQHRLRERGALSVKTCVLLVKTIPREVDVQPDFSGFEIDDHFVVGYGLDYEGYYRNLPMIGLLTHPGSPPA